MTAVIMIVYYSFLSSTAGFVFAALRVCQRTESREMTWDGESLNMNPGMVLYLPRNIIVANLFIMSHSLTLTRQLPGKAVERLET